MFDLQSFNKIHIIGIAGAGLNGTANLFLDQGKKVSGADRLRNAATEYLEARGVTITADDDITEAKDADVILISSAVKTDHPVVKYTGEHNILVITRHHLWETWSKQREIIAVSGSHGKTTTTAMIAHIFKTTKHECGFVVGIHGKGAGAWGSGPFILEGDEYARTFLSITPKLAVITAIDRDHVDVYKSDQEYEDTFREFVQNTLKNNGSIIACNDDSGVQRVLKDCQYTSYGTQSGTADWSAQNITVEGGGLRYDLLHDGQKVVSVALPVPGEHNVLNSVAAIIVAHAHGIGIEAAAKALATLPGLYRRMQYKGETSDGIKVFDDYAHAPAEVEATLHALKQQYPDRRLIAYFQPHTFSRLEAFFNDYARILPIADVVLVDEVYAAREVSGSISSVELVAELSTEKKYATRSPEDAVQQLMSILQPNDVLVTLTAGSGTMIGGKIIDLKGQKQ